MCSRGVWGPISNDWPLFDGVYFDLDLSRPAIYDCLTLVVGAYRAAVVCRIQEFYVTDREDCA